MDVTTNRTRRSSYEKFIHHNIASVKKNAMCIPSHSNEVNADDENISTTALATLSTWMELHHILQQSKLQSVLNLSTFSLFSGPVFDTVWTGPFNESRPIQQTSAFDLFLAGVEERVTCTGQACHYDPHPAKPKPLTCHVSA